VWVQKCTLVQVLTNACDIHLSQLLSPSIKGNMIYKQISKEEKCKNHLCGHILLTKGDKLLTNLDLKT